ncbi:MAG: aminotransferase class III-fold pyridoxal phosphate-dependent enzyme, partial [Pseudomonadales bacterium]
MIDLDSYWMPFTGNREFRRNPRLIERAEGVYFYTPDGRRVLDGLSGLWCCGAGHGRREIVAAISEQARTLDYAPAFQFGHPKAFELASRIR